MAEKIRRKLSSKRGESLVETLVSLLIASLALVMLAGTMTASSGIITKGRDKLKVYYDENELDNGVVKRKVEGSQSGENTITIKDETATINQSNKVIYFKNSQFGSKTVVAYELENE